MNECETCGEPISPSIRMTVEDGVMCKRCYSQVSDSLRRGMFTIQEAKNELEMLELYKAMLLDMADTIKRHLNVSKEIMVVVINDVRKMEMLHGIKRYKKNRECLSYEEHISVMDNVFDSGLLMEGKALTREEHKKYVNVFRHYTKGLKTQFASLG